MGRRIVQLASLMLTAGLTVPLALALAQAPEPTPGAPAPAKKPADGELPDLPPVEEIALPPVSALPAPDEQNLLQKAVEGDAPKAKSKTRDKDLPGPKSLTLPAANAKPAAEKTQGRKSKPLVDLKALLTKGQGEMPNPPVAEPAPSSPEGEKEAPLPKADAAAAEPAASSPEGEKEAPLPKAMPPAGQNEEPARLPFTPADAKDMPETITLPKTAKDAGRAFENSGTALPRGQTEDNAALDAQLQQSQARGGAPAGERNPNLPPALEPNGKPGAAPDAAPSAADGGVEAFVLPADQLPLGRQAVGLSVDVVSPQFLNLNQEASLKIIVKNTGTTDAKGVVVRDELPAGLTFQSSQPIAQTTPGNPLLVWRLGTVAAGSERVILLRVIPKTVGAFEHAATVSMQAGAKARTLVREPKLKVEQIVSSAKVQKGQQVEWRIAVTNTGNGPAHRVVVQAKLTPGLRHESGEPNDQNLFEQEIDQLEPGQRITLDPLVTDAIMGGAQTCTVAAQSPDVTTALEEARNTQTVNVVEPKLAMTVVGPDTRFTDTIARYDVTLANPGTATARKIRVLATLPVSGRLVTVPPGAKFDGTTRKLIWNLTQLDPNEKSTFSFQVRMGGAGRYEVAVESRAEGGLHDERLKSTNVEGLADLDMEVSEKRRVVDAGDTAVFQIKITNRGTKEATHLLLRGHVSNNLSATKVDVENNEDARFNSGTGEIMFPKIDRLGPGKETVLYVQVQALPKPGLATLRVELMHDDLDNGKLEDIGSFRITPARTVGK